MCKEDIIQFQIPQNIDMEDKIVGPLTLTQFLYLLGGGLLIYVLFQSLGKGYFAVFILLSIPIALTALGLAFLKIQEQSLSHFIVAGIQYLTNPKVRIWHRRTNFQPILTAPVKEEKIDIAPTKHVDKSALDQLAYKLDTQPLDKKEEKKLGSVANVFEKLLKEQPKTK